MSANKPEIDQQLGFSNTQNRTIPQRLSWENVVDISPPHFADIIHWHYCYINWFILACLRLGRAQTSINITTVRCLWKLFQFSKTTFQLL